MYNQIKLKKLGRSYLFLTGVLATFTACLGNTDPFVLRINNLHYSTRRHNFYLHSFSRTHDCDIMWSQKCKHDGGRCTSSRQRWPTDWLLAVTSYQQESKSGRARRVWRWRSVHWVGELSEWVSELLAFRTAVSGTRSPSVCQCNHVLLLTPRQSHLWIYLYFLLLVSPHCHQAQSK